MTTLGSTRRPWSPAAIALGAVLLFPVATAVAQPEEGVLLPSPRVTQSLFAEATFPAMEPTVAAQAQEPAPGAGIDHLRRQLFRGDKVSIVRSNGDTVRGRIQRVGAEDLDIATGSRRERLNLTVPFAAIQSLERPRDSSRDGALIGMGVGAGFSAALFAYAYAVDANESDEWSGLYIGTAALYTGLSTLIGWAIDTVHSKPHFRYEAPRAGSVSVRPVPLVARGPGVGVVVTF